MNYLNNKNLFAEVVKSKKQGSITEELGRMFLLLAYNFAKKPNYNGYTYVEDMAAYAVMHLVRTWEKFDETKYSNAFAYYTTCVYNSFNQYLNKEKTQREVRDEILLKQGKAPSFTYSLDHANDEYHG